ncbi:hypothetical protein EVAR_60929_1 [Eumeta japonica]|uniref:Uncharacterized protein n=1 Tax=Eumeta variegata TaxID=151549 RepID=A0A4C1ZF54_EUMVA|nr:hypothetical protein EVAR_60929_1 [Eumeta japonica]
MYSFQTRRWCSYRTMETQNRLRLGESKRNIDKSLREHELGREPKPRYSYAYVARMDKVNLQSRCPAAALAAPRAARPPFKSTPPARPSAPHEQIL